MIAKCAAIKLVAILSLLFLTYFIFILLLSYFISTEVVVETNGTSSRVSYLAFCDFLDDHQLNIFFQTK